MCDNRQLSSSHRALLRQEYTSWDNDDRDGLLASTIQYEVQLGDGTTTTAGMLASLFEHLAILGCPKYEATLETGAEYVRVLASHDTSNLYILA